MLNLTRKTGEAIVLLDGEIIIKVKSCRSGSVTLSIEAPKHMSVDREEIYKRKISKFPVSE